MEVVLYWLRSRIAFRSRGNHLGADLGICRVGSPLGLGRSSSQYFRPTDGCSTIPVLSRRSQPDGQETRDTLAAVGLFGFALVPITALATTWYQKRHPGIVLVNGEETGLDPAIRTVLMMGFLSFLILFIGLAMLSNEVIRMEERLEQSKTELDGGL